MINKFWYLVDIFISPKLRVSVEEHLYARFLLFTILFMHLANIAVSIVPFLEGTYIVSFLEMVGLCLHIATLISVLICLRAGVSLKITSAIFIFLTLCTITIFLFSDNSAFASSLLILLFIPMLLQSIAGLRMGLVGLAFFFLGGFLAHQYFPALPPETFLGSWELTRDYLYVACVMIIVPLFVLEGIKKHLQDLTKKELITVHKQLKEQAITDSLTGLYNRRYFDTRLEEAWRQAKRNKASVTLAMLDVDYFKRYNDNYGHVQGDECLIAVTHALSDAGARAGDVYARYGGEEFVMLMPGATAEGGKKVIEECRTRLTEEKISHAYSEVAEHITFSAGIVEITPTNDDNLTCLDLLKRADLALYQAKKEGRDCTVIYEQEKCADEVV